MDLLVASGFDLAFVLVPRMSPKISSSRSKSSLKRSSSAGERAGIDGRLSRVEEKPSCLRVEAVEVCTEEGELSIEAAGLEAGRDRREKEGEAAPRRDDNMGGGDGDLLLSSKEKWSSSSCSATSVLFSLGEKEEKVGPSAPPPP